MNSDAIPSDLPARAATVSAETQAAQVEVPSRMWWK